MNKIKLLILSFATWACVMPTHAREQLSLPLDEAIARARASSVDAAVALNKLRAAYWEHRTYRAELLPELTLNANLPNYYKQYAPYQNADGTYSFVRNNYVETSAELSVSQNIWLTGGTLSLNTSLNFLRQLDGDRYNRFMSIPVALTLNQPIFGVNHIRWKRRIEPVRYDEARAEFLSATEDVAMNAISYYFNLIMAQENLATAQMNLDYAVKLHEVAVEKRRMGRISENDLLQMELNELNARATLTDCQSALKSNMFRLRSFLGIPEDVDIVPMVPGEVPDVKITYADALDKAMSRNKFSKNLARRQLEADYAVAQAKGDLRQISLFAQVGYTGTGNSFGNAYNPLKDNQVVQIGFSIPIVDWGKRRGKVRVAQSNRQLEESRLRQETQNFKQDLYILVERFNNQQQQLQLARRADAIATRRYMANVETFMVGKISTLDLNDSQTKKDESRQQLINELYLFWNYYYQIRSLTLWNYADNCDIDADFNAILRNR